MADFSSGNRIKNAWAFYDWANSVYPLVITSTIFPKYYNTVTTSGDGSDIVRFLGFDFVNTALYSYALSFSFLLVALIAPFLSGIADYGGKKKAFMRFFAWLGALSCSLLFFFTGPNLVFGIAVFILASIGFSGSLVFYNAYLPEIAAPHEQDRLSARGFSMGYIGSVILLSFNLWMVLQPGTFGIAEGSSLPARTAFLSVGLWWFGFSLIPFTYLPTNFYQKPQRKSLIFQGFRELAGVWRSLQEQPFLRGFLGAFFLYSVGLQTVMYLAPTFGAKTIGLSSGELTLSILIIQLVAIGGAMLFARLSGIIGNIGTLIVMILIWIGVCISAYFVYDATGFYVLAFGVGLVMGGVQSLSRSTYSKFLPETQDHASYFSFYDITEKVSIVIGTLGYGLIEELTGSMRNSVMLLVGFFIGGLILLIRLSYLDRKALAGRFRS